MIPATDDPPTRPEAEAAIAAQLDEGDELIVQTDPPGAGPALARNLGAERSTGDALVFVDADVVAAPGSLERIRDALAAPGGPDAIFGAYDAEPRASGAVSRYRNLLHRHVHLTGAGPAETFWAGLGAVRRDAFVASGGFDARRFRSPSVEDIELGMRLRSAGASIELDPAIEGKHLKRWTLASMIGTDHARRGRPWTRLILESRTVPNRLNLTPARRASAAASVLVVVAAALRRPRPALAALGVVGLLNLSFLRTLAAAGGLRLAAAGLLLHVSHEVAAASAVPAAMIQHHLGDRRGPLS